MPLGEENDIVMFVPSGNSWSGWKFSHNDCGIGGEWRVTRKRSGGVAGMDNPPGKGEAGRVPPRDGPGGKNWSAAFLRGGEDRPATPAGC